jgi:two-component system, OmpR family, phosphate regulon sensor histidine kinase PhoR
VRSTERLSRLVESLLDFRRMEAGARPYVLESVDAAAFTRRVAEEFRRETGAEVHVTAEDGAWIAADAGALSLAVWNLLDNAVKYAPGSAVELRVRGDGGVVRISVADRGPGIAASDQRSIFDKFVRGREATELGVKGTGIGLAMVKHVAEAHRGRVELESSPGAGSVFTIVLPGVAS